MIPFGVGVLLLMLITLVHWSFQVWALMWFLIAPSILFLFFWKACRKNERVSAQEREHQFRESQKRLERDAEYDAQRRREEDIITKEEIKRNARQKKTNELTVKRDLKELSRNRRRLCSDGDYGIIDFTGWKVHLKAYVEKKLHLSGTEAPELWMDFIDQQIDAFHEEPTETNSKRKKPKDLTPTEFESACAETLERHGWRTQLTKASGDQGIDIIAIKSRKRVAIQCKLYTKPVGNKAVQEAIAGKSFIEAEFACVVSNAIFTRSAKELASTAGVILLHPDNLRQLDALTSVSARRRV